MPRDGYAQFEMHSANLPDMDHDLQKAQMMASSLTASLLFRDLFQKSFPAESYDVDVAEEGFDALARMRGVV